MRVAAAALVTLLCACATTPAPSPAPAANDAKPATPTTLPIPEDLRVSIQRARDIGSQLYILDKVAAIGTDVLMERVPDFRAKNLGGYLPVREADDDGRPTDAYHVQFFTSESPPRIAYDVRVVPKQPPELKTFAPPLAGTDSFVALVHAREVALAAMPPSRQPINPVLVPGELNGESGVLVYMLAGTTKPDVAVFGRHFRALVPIGASSVTYMMPLSNSALELPLRAPDGGTTRALTVTHVVTDYPIETHVFTSLLLKLPVYVATRRGIWHVDGDAISLVSDKLPD